MRSRYCYVLLENIYIFGNMFNIFYFLTEMKDLDLINVMFVIQVMGWLN